MKRIVSTLGTLALAFSLGGPMFAATAPRPQTTTKAATTKSPAKRKTTGKKSTTTAHKAAPANAKSVAPQSK